jgi:signal transduction histidine kinase/CheY-like chemotaxis protein
MPMGAGRILVVDDEADVVALCRRVLTKADYEIAGELAPEAGLQALAAQPFDLLLVDIRMPGMDGFDMIRQAKQLQPDLAVVIMTGFGTVETAARALEEGASGLVLKPFESNKVLLRQVQSAIEGNRAIREAARSRAFRPLFDLTEVLFSVTEESNLAARIVSAVQGQVTCDVVALYRWEEMLDQPRLLAGQGHIPPGKQIKSEYSPVSLARFQRVAMHLSPKMSDLPEQTITWLKKNSLANVLSIPVRQAEAMYFILIGRHDPEAVFSDAQIEMLILLARQAAVALENARLYGELREYVQEIERSQQRLVQTEKLAAIGRLTASIAHEVNNPLQSLRNCLDLAGRPGVDEEQHQRYLAMAHQELERLSWIVQQMLEFYRPEDATRQLVDLNQVVKDVAGLTESQSKSQSVKVQLRLTESPLRVWGVAFQLQQVALNLVLNAMEAMPQGGSLDIVTYERAGRMVMAFRDNGRGIAREELLRIFEPFYTSKDSGTGLGLAISYGIISAHGGVIEVESQPGQGSEFRVVLPAQATEP